MHRFKGEISQTTSLQSPGIEVTQRSRGDIATTPFHAQNLGGKDSRMGCKPPNYRCSASQRNTQPQRSHTLKSCHSETQAWEKCKALGATQPIILQTRHHPKCTPIQKLSFIILIIISQGVIKKMPRDSLDACTGFVAFPNIGSSAPGSE